MLQTDEDLKNLELDKPGRGKSFDQIKKHSVPEAFAHRPVERALQLLTKGDEVQKLNVLNCLPELYKADAQTTCTRVIPKIQQELQCSSSEFHIATSKSFKFIIEKRLPINTIPNIMQGLDSRDPVVVNAWLELLVDVVLNFPEEVIKKEIFPVAIEKANVSQPVPSRIVSCALLGKLALYPKFEQKDIKNVILPAIQGLCQDCSPEVRSAICAQLPNIFLALGADLNSSSLISSLVELASDNSPGVRSTALITIVSVTPMLDNKVKIGIILPLVKQLCTKSQSRDDVTGTVVTKQFGKLVNSLLPIMNNENIAWFLQTYKVLAHRGLSTKAGDVKGDPAMDMVCRDNCAYNLPSVANLVATKLPDQIETIYGIFRDLTADPCYIVRKTVSTSIHEILKILGPNSKVIRPDIVRLLRDDAEEVLISLVPNLGNILSLLATNNILSKDKADQSTMEIARAILKCQLELTKGYNWRLLTSLLEQEEHFPDCMPPDFIHQHFTPVVMGNVIHGRARPVREQGAKTLLTFLKCIKKDVNQKSIRDSLISQLCYSDSCYTRIIYVRMCKHALRLFPAPYFRDNFFTPLMSLLEDPISNIRYSVVCMIPKLKQFLAANDPKARQTLLDAVAKIELKEKDRDVLEKLRSGSKELNEWKSARPALAVRKTISSLPPGTTDVQKVKNINRPLPTKESVSFVQPAPQKQAPPRQQKTVTLPQQAAQKRPRNVNEEPAKPARDMTFLRQHFYVDAGVDIPIKDALEPVAVVVTKEGAVEGLTATEIDSLRSSTTNITDDVKVNLRRLTERSSSRLQRPKSYLGDSTVNKRHSSVLPRSFDNTPSPKALHRRSLDVQLAKESSRIPVISRSAKKQVGKENARIIGPEYVSGLPRSEPTRSSAQNARKARTNDNNVKSRLAPSPT